MYSLSGLIISPGLTGRRTQVFGTVVCLLVLLMASGCSSADKRRKSKNIRARQEWRMEIEDSIRTIERRIESNASLIRTLTEDIDGMLPAFSKIDNPAHVEGYYILTDFASKYPLRTTGLAARLTLSEQLELIAALHGGVFTRIRVSDRNSSVESDNVPYDGALNYRSGGMTTVAFSGAQCDSVGRFISLNSSSTLKLEFLDGDRVTGTFTLPEDMKRMVGRTWVLANIRTRLTALERTIPLDNAKLESLRRRLEKDSIPATM